MISAAGIRNGKTDDPIGNGIFQVDTGIGNSLPGTILYRTLNILRKACD
jgi:hypothetical protein